MKCIHGIDPRFCANCNRATKANVRSSVGDVSLEDILEFLNHEQVRATYGAVADVLGSFPGDGGSSNAPDVEARQSILGGER